jgi:hypothetical protein
MKQQLNDKVQYTRLLAAWPTLTHGSSVPLDLCQVLYVLRCQILINPVLEITCQRFRWWWEKFSANTLQENITVNDDDIIKNMQCKCRTETTFLGFSLFQPSWTERWAMDKPNTSYRTYHALNSWVVCNLSRICTVVFLHQLEVCGHD